MAGAVAPKSIARDRNYIQAQIQALLCQVRDLEVEAAALEDQDAATAEWHIEDSKDERAQDLSAFPEGVDKTSIEFPQGIACMKQWGQTIIEFGKEYRNRTYQGVIASHGEREAKYVKWVAGLTAPSMLMLDFQKYIRAHQLLHPPAADTGSIHIPGTNHVRRLAADGEADGEPACT